MSQIQYSHTRRLCYLFQAGIRVDNRSLKNTGEVAS